MYICLCHGITDTQIRTCFRNGARTLGALSGQLGIATQCGGCADSACEVLEELLRTDERACTGAAAHHAINTADAAPAAMR